MTAPRATLHVLVYDVGCDKRRNKLHSLLKQYGVPVQESAFEARLTRPEKARLLERAHALLDPVADRFVVYAIPSTHEPLIEVVGAPRPEQEDPGYYLI